MNRTMSIAALVISLVALGLAAHAHLNADSMAVQALHRREQKMIDSLWPDMKVIYADLLGEAKGQTREKPETIEDLFAPLVTMFEEIGR